MAPPVTTGSLTDGKTTLGQFRACVMADEALALSLSHAEEPDRFVDLAMSSAGARGIRLTAETVQRAIRPDPLGLARFTSSPPGGTAWPPRHWLPIHVSALGGQITVNWALFGPTPLTDPFFEGSIRRALSHPFNRMFRYRMTLDDFLRDAQRQSSLAPSGFIFHMSRCGSTLVAQMLAAIERNIVISEAAPIDATVQLGQAWPHVPGDRHVQLLRAMIAAFGRQRSGGESHYFIKLDSWHALALPLFRRAFPAVPWVFLYRDPVEVMVSQIRERGSQMVPAIVPPALYGIDDAESMPDEAYCAHVLNTICTAAADRLGEGDGLPVNYRELPGAMGTRILPHFGVAYDAEEREIMDRTARNDAKAPGFKFENDTDFKQHGATQAIRASAELYLGETYRRLEALCRGAPT